MRRTRRPQPSTIIIATGNGLQAWWLFKTPWIFASEGDRKSASTLSSRFQTLLRHNASRRGWSFERLSDLARVLRIPGTINAKDPNNPKDVRVYSSIDRHYDPSEFQNYLDVLAIPDAEAEQLAAKEWAERCADKPLVINLNARIPQEMLDHWLEADTRFKDTWFRQRHDLNDQSQSGYDMALACFAVGAGLSEQQSIDLIVHHRSLRRQQRTRLDYFQKTLTKAANMTGGQRASAESTVGCRDQNQSPVPESDPVNSDNLAADAATVKAQLWDRLSEILGIRVYRMVKITGNEDRRFVRPCHLRGDLPALQSTGAGRYPVAPPEESMAIDRSKGIGRDEAVLPVRRCCSAPCLECLRP